MKTQQLLRSFLLSPIVLFAGALSAQSIVTGEHGTNDHFVDLDPDMHITQAPYPGSEPGEFALDMDGNGTTDITLHAFFDGGLGTNYRTTSLACAAHVRIARGDQPCGQNSAFSFASGQTIDGSLSWTSGSGGLSHLTWSMGDTLDYYNCFPVAGYLGVRLATGQDTAYGWVRLWATGGPLITVDEYACNTIASGVEANPVSPDRSYFDPARNELSILLGAPASEGWTTRLYDMQGRAATLGTAANGSDRMVLTLDRLAAGAYTFVVRGSARVMVSGRICVVH